MLPQVHITLPQGRIRQLVNPWELEPDLGGLEQNLRGVEPLGAELDGLSVWEEVLVLLFVVALDQLLEALSVLGQLDGGLLDLFDDFELRLPKM